MEITEVRIKLMEDAQERLQAFCSITIDGCFVVRDLKIIRGTKGSFVAMPSRKLTDRCGRCGAKNCLRAQFCSECGVRLSGERAEKGQDGRARLYADIAHPINSCCRELIQRRVLSAYSEELELAQQPGYVCRYDEFGEIDTEFAADEWGAARDIEAEGAAGEQGEVTRRIEPAAAAAGPHPPRERGWVAEPLLARGEEDEFGAGII